MKWEYQERKGWEKNIFKEIVAKNFPRLLKNDNLHTQESQQTPSRINLIRPKTHTIKKC